VLDVPLPALRSWLISVAPSAHKSGLVSEGALKVGTSRCMLCGVHRGRRSAPTLPLFTHDFRSGIAPCAVRALPTEARAHCRLPEVNPARGRIWSRRIAPPNWSPSWVGWPGFRRNTRRDRNPLRVEFTGVVANVRARLVIVGQFRRCGCAFTSMPALGDFCGVAALCACTYAASEVSPAASASRRCRAG